MKSLRKVPLDEAAVVDAAARLTLRTPNAEALEAVAKAVDASPGVSIEAVCSLATGVGKTYLAAGLVDYFVAGGVRNFLIVTPGTTVLRKTVNNFTPGHPKSVIDGLGFTPMVITAEDFNTGAVASALDDDEIVKVFVFNVQGLSAPRKGSKKRTHEFTEWLGGNLYKHLSALDDLIIVSDEHHTYSEQAEVYSATIRSLEPVALVGLTATPAASDLKKVVYDYPLARAIVDGYVKTPVLVGRTDGSKDRELQLRDGLALLAAKQKLADEWATANARTRVNAVMFVVAETIDEATDAVALLRKPGLFETDYAERVLVVHSEAADEALARLDQVEDPDSPVRVIVSVSMLKEGWDVKNIYVICSFRPSISDTLTEQTLGRGLRLPWGEYTGEEFLDTVEVLSHERYADILKKADVLLDGLVARRLEPDPAPARPGQQPTSAGATSAEPGTESAGPSAEEPGTAGGTSRPAAPTPGPGGHFPPAPPEPGIGVPAAVASGTAAAPVSAAVFVDGADHEPAPAVSTLERRMATAEEAAQLTSRDVPRRMNFAIPQVTRVATERKPLSLSTVTDAEFRALGAQMAAMETAKLSRMELTIIEDPTSETGLKLVPTELESIVSHAAIIELPFEDVPQTLKRGLLGIKFVKADKPEDGGAASRLARAFIAGANGAENVAPYTSQAIVAMGKYLQAKYKQQPEQVENTIGQPSELPEKRTVLRKQEANRFGAFERSASYTGWSAKACYPEAWFDSSTERDFANLLDAKASETVAAWVRLNRDVTIEWEGGRYFPDFLLVTTDGSHYLVEVKGDDKVEDATVAAKAQAAADWARYVTDNGTNGRWHYLFVPQQEVDAKTPVAALIARLTSA